MTLCLFHTIGVFGLEMVPKQSRSTVAAADGVSSLLAGGAVGLVGRGDFIRILTLRRWVIDSATKYVIIIIIIY